MATTVWNEGREERSTGRADFPTPVPARGQGFEPRQGAPKAPVLPLDDPRMPGHLRQCRGPDLNWGHRNFQSRALPTELPRRRNQNWKPSAGAYQPRFQLVSQSGRWDSNPRPSPWQGDVLPLNYTRAIAADGLHYTYFHRAVKLGPPSAVDPTGFEPVISSVQGRRLPARLRAQKIMYECGMYECRMWNVPGAGRGSPFEIQHSKVPTRGLEPRRPNGQQILNL